MNLYIDNIPLFTLVPLYYLVLFIIYETYLFKIRHNYQLPIKKFFVNFLFLILILLPFYVIVALNAEIDAQSAMIAEPK